MFNYLESICDRLDNALKYALKKNPRFNSTTVFQSSWKRYVWSGNVIVKRHSGRYPSQCAFFRPKRGTFFLTSIHISSTFWMCTNAWIDEIHRMVDREVSVIFFTQAVITSPAITEDGASRPIFFSNDQMQNIHRSIFHRNKEKFLGPPFNFL